MCVCVRACMRAFVRLCVCQRERERVKKKERERELVSWYFKPCQPQRITSGLMETFTKRYIVERTNKGEIRPEEQSEKRRVFKKIYGMKYS